MFQVAETVEVYKAERENVESNFKKIYEHALRMAERVGTAPCKPRVTKKQQQHRNCICTDTVIDHYWLSAAVPFLDHVIADIRNQFSCEFILVSE